MSSILSRYFKRKRVSGRKARSARERLHRCRAQGSTGHDKCRSSHVLSGFPPERDSTTGYLEVGRCGGSTSCLGEVERVGEFVTWCAQVGIELHPNVSMLPIKRIG